MIDIKRAVALDGRTVRLTLSNGLIIERDLTDLLHGPVFERIASDDSVFRKVRAHDGTIVWPGDVDIAPETLIWDGPTPSDEATRRPVPFLRPQRPVY